MVESNPTNPADDTPQTSGAHDPRGSRVLICPYCGATQPPDERCRACAGLFEPLSRQATHNAMGPWSIRDADRPFQPGCSYETLVRLVERGRVTKYTILRGPTTRQFWTVARHVAGVAHLLGYCHACDAEVDPGDHGCPDCGVPFGAYLDRNFLGLPEVRPLPGQAPGDDAMPGTGWNAPRMTPRGLSSFADDAVLLGRAARPADPRPDEYMDDDAERALGGEASGEGGVESWLRNPAVRSMQRRLARQQRTIRVLTALVIVVALLGALFNVFAVAGRPAPPPDPVPFNPPAPAREAVQEPAQENDADDTSVDPALVPAPEPAEDASISAPVEPAPDATPAAWQADWDAALEQSAIATDGEKPLDERLEAAVLAMERLRAIRSAYPAPGGPPRLDAELRDLEDEHERLTLRKEFFR